MIGWLEGRPISLSADRLVLDVGGVGYEIYAPSSVLARIGARMDEDIDLFVHTHVSQDRIALYGFEGAEARDTFRILIGISGVGPRSALAILSVLGLDELRRAVAIEDARTLQRVPGVGRKTAGRILVELGEKGLQIDTVQTSSRVAGRTAGVPSDPVRHDAASALKALGFPPKDSLRAVETVLGGEERDLGVEDVVTRALRLLTRSGAG